MVGQKNQIVHKILEDISEITKLAVDNQENPSVIKYNVGGEYKTHHDFFHLHQCYSEESLKRGGQRVKTALIYLNEGFSGGGTFFPHYDLTITPQIGKLLIWDNLNKDGSLKKDSLHAGLPVKSGVKYIITVWIRENLFIM